MLHFSTNESGRLISKTGAALPSTEVPCSLAPLILIGPKPFAQISVLQDFFSRYRRIVFIRVVCRPQDGKIQLFCIDRAKLAIEMREVSFPIWVPFFVLLHVQEKKEILQRLRSSTAEMT